ncbi:phosphate ABC transporter permease subunit PstC [Leptotrichia sp. OH3620_COT-345]|uniref:phosphate ABC transporter permease subunit PstC n=1 Tax=Leptotrichia sp. OH3620_COT-345 TaxID=2491048 RepID=UPI000F64A9CF|nr:phosphate ABC transporter permease subunit PstC [Leptotrichia sp. OH3620_COT-345]RRD39611.1 phosphate ABC transporter permease subunit PstC [Leptotrichia sp. OH3620_COT-345]
MKKFFKYSIYLFTGLSILILLILLIYLFSEAFPFFKEQKILNFILGKSWRASEPKQSFQIFNILYAGFYISILACIISFPISYGVSMYICFYSKGVTKKIIIWTVNILSGIPSVIYGFFGLTIILKVLEKNFSMSTGESVIAGGLILSIMIIPFFVGNCMESIKTVKKKFQKDSDSLGVTKEYFIRKIVFKETRLSIITSFLLAFARATGETMAVMMVIGNSPQTPKLLSKAETIPALIALEIGMSEVGSKHYSALFASAFVLLFTVIIINIIFFILNGMRKTYVEK